MHFQYSLWRLFAATSAVAALFAVIRPQGIVPVTAASFGAIGLGGLILSYNRGDAGLICRSAAWTFAGGYFGMQLSPSPLFHEPLEFLFCGMFVGWAVGVLARRLRGKSTEEKEIRDQ
jgi:hypothetical protein